MAKIKLRLENHGWMADTATWHCSAVIKGTDPLSLNLCYLGLGHYVLFISFRPAKV